ncbi:hypothetical protein B0H11DRAFT_2108325 [Mycena galericulata]|nr:hypothetical protein B0H11DRAFT_2108325 [Mycena galericulata]
MDVGVVHAGVRHLLRCPPIVEADRSARNERGSITKHVPCFGGQRMQSRSTVELEGVQPPTGDVSGTTCEQAVARDNNNGPRRLERHRRQYGAERAQGFPPRGRRVLEYVAAVVGPVCVEQIIREAERNFAQGGGSADDIPESYEITADSETPEVANKSLYCQWGTRELQSAQNMGSNMDLRVQDEIAHWDMVPGKVLLDAKGIKGPAKGRCPEKIVIRQFVEDTSPYFYGEYTCGGTSFVTMNPRGNQAFQPPDGRIQRVRIHGDDPRVETSSPSSEPLQWSAGETVENIVFRTG